MESMRREDVELDVCYTTYRTARRSSLRNMEGADLAVDDVRRFNAMMWLMMRLRSFLVDMHDELGASADEATPPPTVAVT